MTWFECNPQDQTLMAQPTVSTASGSIATFDTDMTENLVECVCQIVAQQSGSGTPSPSNPRPITTYTSLNLSHSGADTSNPTVYNIPFGQTVAQGLLNVGTGKLRVTHRLLEFDYTSAWVFENSSAGKNFYVACDADIKTSQTSDNMICNVSPVNNVATVKKDHCIISAARNFNFTWGDTLNLTSANEFKTYLQTNNLVIQVIAELATPIEIQLDSITLQALLNENNIWCDTGDTEVKYLLTVGKKIS